MSSFFFFFLMIRRPPRSTHCISSAASDVYKRQYQRRVHGWDSNLQTQVTVIDLKQGKIKVFSQKIIALAESKSGRLAIGLRSSEILEITTKGTQTKETVVMKGHYEGELWGLAVHPKEQQFFTVGEDNLLACWDIVNRRMLLGVKLEFPAKAIHISPNGNFLAIGCINGSIQIVDPKSLVVTFTFKDRDNQVTCIKYSPDSEYLAVAYDAPSCEILIYNVKNHYKNEAKLRSSTSRITHMDFSSPSSKKLQVNNAKYEIPVSYTHLRAHETRHDLVCRLLLEKKKKKQTHHNNKNIIGINIPQQ
eukprot:TRINITY_DN2306_c0_g1_i1.p1 TRINITY_DN2306_c0_g1~~TRINITY_DN2306_c0_g1_i1.p1  ORF type:complete len:305 (+),score=68.37 TRINITY_DN2306_c0_g1_i1:115-1029(+)